MLIEDREIEISENYPFANEKLQEIAETFSFTKHDIYKMYQSFRKLDQKATGYITLDDIYQLCNEDLSSVVAPYIESFFSRIHKENQDRVSFIELMPSISAFCLYTKK